MFGPVWNSLQALPIVQIPFYCLGICYICAIKQFFHLQFGFVLILRLLFDFPLWTVGLCFLLALGYAAMLYWRNPAADFGPRTRWILAALRFVLVFLISFLLLAPVLQRQRPYIEEPLLIFLQDNSRSVSLRDSSYYQSQYPVEVKDFLLRLSEHYTLRSYALGEDLRAAENFDFSDKVTDIAAAFAGMANRYNFRNVGAVILASDGLYNRGLNPLQAIAHLPFPVYTIALGDTMPARDLLIARLQHNRISYQNNQFPLVVDLEAHQAAGKRTQLRVLKDGHTVFSQNLTFDQQQHFQSLTLYLEAVQTGMQKYTVLLEAIENEISLENNQRDFYIEVIDGRRKVLILGDSPHPDIGALSEAITRYDQYEVEVKMADDLQGGIENYDVVIFHQLPSARPLNMEVFQRRVPRIFVLGSHTHLGKFNSLGAGLRIQQRSGDFAEAYPSLNEAFKLFHLHEDLPAQLMAWPPLHTFFANFEQSPASTPLMLQRVGNLVTDQMLISAVNQADQKTGFIAGEGIWRWRQHNFARSQNHDAFDALINAMIQYVSVVEDKGFFRVSTAGAFMENQTVLFEAELYNKAYELVNTPEVVLEISDEAGKRYPFQFGRKLNAYALHAGVFPPGAYTWQATASLGAETYTQSGAFAVSALQLEDLKTQADHNLLFQIARHTDAAMFYPGQWDPFLEHLAQRSDLKPILYTRKTADEAIDFRFLFFLLVILLASEWFIRKYTGFY